MQDAFFMGRSQRFSQCSGDLQNMFKRVPLDQFHGEKVDAVILLHRVQRYNIWMVECGDSASLALEAGQALGVVSHLPWQDLKRHIAPELRVRRAIHHTHSATAELLNDAVVRDGLPDHWAEILGPVAEQVNESVGLAHPQSIYELGR